MPKLVEFIYQIQLDTKSFDEAVDTGFADLVNHVLGDESEGRMTTRISEQGDSHPLEMKRG